MKGTSPLSWPADWPRIELGNRAYGRFGKREQPPGRAYSSLKDVTVSDGTKRVLGELARMRAGEVIISTNLTLRLDGLPRPDQRAPNDPGVAVYWTDAKGRDRCIAVDRYTTVADNLAAIAATLDAMRAIERHGGAEVMDRAFTGFTALEGPAATSWRDVLDVAADASRDQIENAYRALRGKWHPDKPGGDADRFHEITQAYGRCVAEQGR